MLSEHSIAQSPRAQHGTIRVKAVRLWPKMYNISFQPVGLMRALTLMVRSSRITSTAGYSACICCTYSRPTGNSVPSLRRSVSAPVLPRARHTHMDWIRILDSGFGFGLDCIGLRTHLPSICCHLPSSCCHLPSGGGNLLFFIWIRLYPYKSQARFQSIIRMRAKICIKHSSPSGRIGRAAVLCYLICGSGRGIRWSRASAGCRRFLPGSPARR